MNYFSIRKLHYKNQRKRHLQINVDIDDWFYSPYSCLKARFFIELSALIVSFLQYTPIKPNFITLLFAGSAIFGGFCLSSGSENLIILGVIIFFTYAIFDWTDGLLAIVTKKTSHLGHILDSWGGLVSSFSFLIGIGMYLFNETQEIKFIYIIILIITIKAIDLKDFIYHYVMYDFYKSSKIKKKTKKKNSIDKKEENFSKSIVYIKNFFQSFLDNRSRTVDTIGLIIIFELYYGKIILTNYIYYLMLFKIIVLFAGGIYVSIYKNFAKKIIDSLN